MGGIAKILACTGLITLSASLALGAAIKGSVKGPDEAPYMGAFVMARNSTTKITVTVLSDQRGKYHIDAPLGGEYDVRIRAAPWISPGASQKTISRFDAETGEFTHVPGSEEANGIVLDKDGNCWFVHYVKDGQIGKIDANTGTVTKWTVPTPDSRPRRVDIDSEGNI